MSNTYNVPTEHQDLVEDLRKTTTVDEQAGLVQFDPEAFGRNLPKTLTMSQIDALEQYRADFMGAATLVGGELANDLFKDQSDLTHISGGVSLGGSTTGVLSVVRTDQVGDTTVYGSPRFVVNHQLPDTSDFNIGVREHLMQQAKALLGED